MPGDGENSPRNNRPPGARCHSHGRRPASKASHDHSVSQTGSSGHHTDQQRRFGTNSTCLGCPVYSKCRSCDLRAMLSRSRLTPLLRVPSSKDQRLYQLKPFSRQTSNPAGRRTWIRIGQSSLISRRSRSALLLMMLCPLVRAVSLPRQSWVGLTARRSWTSPDFGIGGSVSVSNARMGLSLTVIQGSPIPLQPTDIQVIGTCSRATQQDFAPGQLSSSLIS